MKTHNVQDSGKVPERRQTENIEQATWRKTKEDISDEVLHSKITGVGKAKRKTRRGKRGGVRRKMQKLQREHKMLEAVVGDWIKDIRHKMEAPQSDHAPSRDVTVDVLASDVDEMSITHSHVDPLLDYEHNFPQEINHVTYNPGDARSHTCTGSSQAIKDGYSYHGNNSTFAPVSEQMEMVSGYVDKTTGYGQEVTGCGYGNGNEGTACGHGSGHEYACGYGNGQEYGYGYGHGYGNGYSDGSSFYRYFD